MGYISCPCSGGDLNEPLFEENLLNSKSHSINPRLIVYARTQFSKHPMICMYVCMYVFSIRHVHQFIFILRSSHSSASHLSSSGPSENVMFPSTTTSRRPGTMTKAVRRPTRPTGGGEAVPSHYLAASLSCLSYS